MRVATAALWLIVTGCWPGAFKVGDGFSNHKQVGDDLCPNEPEDFDGFRDSDGCPDRDNDEDGVADIDDVCPDEPGVLESPVSRGCPS